MACIPNYCADGNINSFDSQQTLFSSLHPYLGEEALGAYHHAVTCFINFPKGKENPHLYFVLRPVLLAWRCYLFPDFDSLLCLLGFVGSNTRI